jgi:hypothetical protein
MEIQKQKDLEEHQSSTLEFGKIPHVIFHEIYSNNKNV